MPQLQSASSAQARNYATWLSMLTTAAFNFFLTQLLLRRNPGLQAPSVLSGEVAASHTVGLFAGLPVTEDHSGNATEGDSEDHGALLLLVN